MHLMLEVNILSRTAPEEFESKLKALEAEKQE